MLKRTTPRGFLPRSSRSSLLPDTGSRAMEEHTARADALWDRYMNHRYFGFAIRCCVFGTVVYGGLSALHAAFTSSQQSLPIAQRYNALLGWTRVTLISKEVDGDSGLTKFRFALPNPHDRTGHKPVMSVRVRCDEPNRVKRFYTPTNHPDERGVIEFAIRTAGQGRMKTDLNVMRPGDAVYLGRWMKEFDYVPNKWPEVGIVTSKSGVSVALQLLRYSAGLRETDTTMFKMLHLCNRPRDISMKPELEELQRQMGERFKLTYNVLGVPRRSSNAGNEGELAINDAYKGLIGVVTPTTLSASIPEPYTKVVDEGSGEASMKPNHTLVCATNHVMDIVCGATWPVKQWTYLRGPLQGLLRDLGWSSSQVHGFGTTWAILYSQSKLGGSFH